MVVVSGAFSPLPQAAVIAPIAVVAETPEMAATRRPKRREFTVQSCLCHDLARSPVPAEARTGDCVALVAVRARCCCRSRWRIDRRREQVAPGGVDALLRRRHGRRRRGWRGGCGGRRGCRGRGRLLLFLGARCGQTDHRQDRETAGNGREATGHTLCLHVHFHSDDLLPADSRPWTSPADGLLWSLDHATVNSDCP